METLLEYDPKALEHAAGELGLKLVVGFGSRICGEPSPARKSDLDVCVLDPEPYSPSRHLDVYGRLSDVFARYELDLSFLRHADPFFRSEIFRTGRRLYGDAQLYFEQEAYAFKSFADSKDLRDLQHTLFEKKLARIDHALRFS